MQKNVLFTRSESELTVIPDTITLSEAFTNYDFLEFICADNNAIGTRYTMFVAVSALNELLVNGNPYYMRPSYEVNYGWNFTVNTATLLIKYNGGVYSAIVSPKAVYGIKI